MLFSKFAQALSGDYVHAISLSQNEINVNKKYGAESSVNRKKGDRSRFINE
jgi:hypothetical protein